MISLHNDLIFAAASWLMLLASLAVCLTLEPRRGS
jgi:hypothetical protein